ncbi:MAG: hypothetical protein HYV33_01055 [Candidatus Kerfeldbacteria bacterium]|nr:hypothetical protein [Candidatus Kerfeldbacteria bacterium]
MKLKDFRETLPLVFTFSAVLVVGILFFSFIRVDAAWLSPTTETTEDEAPEPTLEQLPVHPETFIMANNDITVEEHFQNDVIVAGQNITINGIVDGDVIAIGATITINAIVHGNVRAAGGNITITNNVDRNVTLFAGTVLITPAALIGKDLFVSGGEVIFAGAVNGSLRGEIGNFTLNGYVGQDVDVQVEATDWRHQFNFWLIGVKIIGWLGLLLVGVVLVKLFARRTAAIVQQMLAQPWRSLVWGMAYVLVVPLGLLVLLLTLIGLPLSLIGVVLFGITLYVAKIYVGTAVGQLLLMNKKNLLWPMLLGVTLYYAATQLFSVLPSPFVVIGSIIQLGLILWAVGSAVVVYQHHGRSR